MKLTKSQLKQIIKEELQEAYGGSFDYGRNPAEELEPEERPEEEPASENIDQLAKDGANEVVSLLGLTYGQSELLWNDLRDAIHPVLVRHFAASKEEL